MPDLDILEPGPDGGLRSVRKFRSYRFGNRVLWAIRRRLPTAWQAMAPMLAWSRFADHRTARWLPPSDVFHGLMGVSQSSLERAKRLGAFTLIDNPTLHPTVFRREVLADYADAAISLSDAEPVMPLSIIRRCEHQYHICDKIVVYSSAAQQSFRPFPYASKTVVLHPGVDSRIFSPARATRSGERFRVCYVGRIEAPKGVHRLIQAWKRLSLPDGELVLIGRVLPGMDGLLAEALGAHIKLVGILPPEEIARCLQDSNLFVFPSVNEGLSLALLEAMSSGLPVVACRGTGAEDCVTPGKEGLLVPGRNTEVLADAILWCYEHRRELPAMGREARTTIEAAFTIAHYERRVMELYRSIATTRS